MIAVKSCFLWPRVLTVAVLVVIVWIGGDGVHAFGQQPAHVSEEYQPYRVNDKCERITMPMCADIPYNMTFYPDSLKHQTQAEAEHDLNQFEMLVNVKCSEDVKFFLCTLFAPVCTQMEYPLPPCRHLCLSAKSGCEGLMLKFGYKWPDMFDCNKFPENGMCVGENRTSSTSSSPAPPRGSGDRKGKSRLPELECPHGMKVLSKSRYALRVANRSVEQCSLPCADDGVVPVFFEQKQRNTLRFYTGLCAVLSCIASGLTVLIFVVDLRRFEFPERSVLFLSFCTLVVSSVYVYGVVYEGGYACASHSISKAPLVTQSMDNFGCTLIAVIHFYFSTAMYCWWLVLCFSWFLVTTLRWGEAPVGRVFAAYFHILAWGLSLLLVIGVLVMNGVDGDMFASICSVGNLQPHVLLHLVAIPHAVLLVIGFVLFVVGLVSIVRIRSYIKSQPKLAAAEDASDKLSRLMTRMTIFALFFVLSAGAALFSCVYQSMYLEEWLTSWYSTRCLHAQRATFGFTQPREQCPLAGSPATVALTASEPQTALFFARHAPFFVVGVACGLWALNSKTFTNLRDCWDRQCHRGRSRVPTADQ